LMAIQRVVERDGIKSSAERGKGLRMVVTPTVQLRVGQTAGAVGE